MSEHLPPVTPLLAGQLRHQLRLLLRTPRALSTGIVLPVLLLVLSESRRGHLPSADLAGYAVLGLSMTAWTTHGIGLVASREAGVLRRWRATPLPAWCYFLGRIAATVLVAAAAGLVTVLAAVLMYGTHLDARKGIELIAALLAGAIACAAPATALTGFVPTVASAFPVLGLTYLPVVVASGVFGPVATEPDWMLRTATYFPVEPAVDAVRHTLVYGSLPARDLAVLAAWAIGGILVALATFRWAPTRPRQRRSARRR